MAIKRFHLAFSSHSPQANDIVFHGAPVVIFVTAPKGNEWAPIDIGMCSQNIMLAAKSLGLGTCPVGLGKYIEETPVYSKLNIPHTEKVLLSIIVGYGAEKTPICLRNKYNAFYIE